MTKHTLALHLSVKTACYSNSEKRYQRDAVFFCLDLKKSLAYTLQVIKSYGGFIILPGDEYTNLMALSKF